MTTIIIQIQCTLIVQQVHTYHYLFKISVAGGFSDPDCEQNTHLRHDLYIFGMETYKSANLRNIAGLVALIMKLYIWKDDMLLSFLKY